MIVDQQSEQLQSTEEQKEARLQTLLGNLGEPPVEISNPLYRDCWVLHASNSQLNKEVRTQPKRPRTERPKFPEFPTEELILETALKLEANYNSLKALLESDQIKYSYVDHLVGILSHVLLKYCPPILKSEHAFLSEDDKKERIKNWKPLIEEQQVRALLRLCDLFSSCKHQISNHSLRDVQKKDIIDIGFYYEDLQMIDNACGVCFNLDNKMYTEDIESKIAPLVCCPSELSEGASFYDQINGDKLINCDLRFSVEQRTGKPPLKYVIPGDVVRNSTQPAEKFVQTLLEQKGFLKHFERLEKHKQKSEATKNVTAQQLLQKLTRELIMKVIWVRYVRNRENLQNGIRCYFQAAYLLETHGNYYQNRGSSSDRQNLFPKAFNDASLFISEYAETFQKCSEERPINRALQIFRLRMQVLIKEILQPLNIVQHRRDNPRFVFDETAAFESILIHKITKQLSSLTLEVTPNLAGEFDVSQQVSDGPLNRAFLTNTSLQEEVVALIGAFTQNLASHSLRQSTGINEWEDIDSNLNKLRLSLIECIKQVFFQPVVEAVDPKGGKHYFMKLHPRIFQNMMFPFKQKWLYEESVAANENPNFKLMEKLLLDWITVYNRGDVYYIKDTCGQQEVCKLEASAKGQMINRILETFMSISTDFRTGIARHFSQQMQNSQILELFESEMLRLDNAVHVNPFFNNFVKIIAVMINQEPTLVNRFLKVEKKLSVVVEEAKEAAIVQVQEPISTFELANEGVPAQQQVQQRQEDAVMEVIAPERDWDDEALLPKIIKRYTDSMPADKETPSNVIRLMGYISVTSQGKSLIKDLGPALLMKALTYLVDNRLLNPDQALVLDRDYIVGREQTSDRIRINTDSLQQLCDGIPVIKQTLRALVMDTIALSSVQAKQILTIHLTETANANSSDYRSADKLANYKVRSTDPYISLIRKANLLTALSSPQKSYFENMMRQPQAGEVMGQLVSYPEDVNKFLDLLELLAMKNLKVVREKFDQVVKIVFAEQELTMDKQKLLFQRIKIILGRIRGFVGKPLSEVRDFDEIMQGEGNNFNDFIPVDFKISRRQHFECLIQVLELYAEILSQLGRRNVAIGTHEKWNEEISTLMWMTTLFQKKQNSILLNVLKGDASLIPNLCDTKYFKALQENIKTKHESKVQLDEYHVEFLELIQSIKAEIDNHIYREYCQYSSKIEFALMLKLIWESCSQQNRVAVQNSVNEVIRHNLKTIGKTAADMVQAMPLACTETDPSALLFHVKANDSMLSHMLKLLSDTKYLKGTFLCQFVACDGLIVLCKQFNEYKNLVLRLQQQDKSGLCSTDKMTLYLVQRYALTSLVKLNQMLLSFCRLAKDNQAYANPAQHMKDDTEPKRYTNIQHFFANYYNQLLHLVVGYPDPQALKTTLQEILPLPDVGKSVVYTLMRELATGFSSIPVAGGMDRPDRDAQDLFMRNLIRDNSEEHEFGYLGINQALQQRQQRQQPRQDRDPTPEEIETVIALGYGVEEADAALRMTNFSIEQAIEMLLTSIEEVVAFSERRQKQKQDEMMRKKQEDIDAAIKKFLGIQEMKIEEVGLKTVTAEQFKEDSVKYKKNTLQQLFEIAYDDGHPQVHQQTITLFVQKLIESGKEEDHMEIASVVLTKLKASFQVFGANAANQQAQRALELDMQLALITFRDFDLLKHFQSKDELLLVFHSIATQTHEQLIKHQLLYKTFTPKISQQALKALDQDEKDLIAQEYCLNGVLFGALQLILHHVCSLSSKLSTQLRKIKIKEQSKSVEDSKLEDAGASSKEEIQTLIDNWMMQVLPQNLFNLIETLLDKSVDSGFCLNKPNFDLVLLLATKLLSHPLWPEDYARQLKQKGLDTVEQAFKSKNAVSGKLMQLLLAICIFDEAKSSQISGEMIKKILLSVAINRKKLSTKCDYESKDSHYKLAKFMDQTQDFYTINPQNVVHDADFKNHTVSLCQVFHQKDGSEIRLKPDVFNALLQAELKQIPEFERLITSTKPNEKQINSLIKQSSESVATKSGEHMQKAIDIIFETLLPARLSYLNKILTFENQKQQVCEFTTSEEAELFAMEFNHKQEEVIELMNCGARFCKAYRCLTPKNAQAFTTQLLDQIHPLIWEIERKKDSLQIVRFKISPQKVEKAQTFLFQFFNDIAGFCRLMSYEENIVCYELRTKLLQQAVQNFSSSVTFLTQAKTETEHFKSAYQARIKAISMLLVINSLVNDDGQAPDLQISEFCFVTSLVTLLCRNKTKFVKHIASLVKLNAKKEPDAAHSNEAKTKKVEVSSSKPNEITYQIDAQMDDALENQELSFASISESLQEAVVNDEHEEQAEDFALENEQLQGILVSQSIECLTAICMFIDQEKGQIQLARKRKQKEEEENKAKENKAEESKLEVPACEQNVQMVQIASEHSEQMSIDESHEQPHNEEENLSESEDEDDEPEAQLIQEGADYIEDEYDAEESEDEGENDEDDDDEEDEEEDDDDMDDDDFDNMVARRVQRRRQAEAQQDIIDAPQNDRYMDRFGLPIMDVGPQHRGMRHEGREVHIGENWSSEERSVQRALALLRGIRPLRAAVPRRIEREGRNPFAPPMPFGQGGDRWGQAEYDDPARALAHKKSQVGEQMNVFAALTGKETYEIVLQAKLALNAARKKFVKPKETNSHEQRIFGLIREQRSPQSQLARSRQALYEHIDFRNINNEFGLGRVLGFPGFRYEEGEALRHYEQLIQERARLFNMQDQLPSERFGEQSGIRLDAEIEEMGQNRMLANYTQLDVPARNSYLQVITQAVQREAEQAPAEEQQPILLPPISSVQPRVRRMSIGQSNSPLLDQPLPAQARELIDSPQSPVALRVELQPSEPVQMLPNISFPSLQLVSENSGQRLLLIEPENNVIQPMQSDAQPSAIVEEAKSQHMFSPVQVQEDAVIVQQQPAEEQKEAEQVIQPVQNVEMEDHSQDVQNAVQAQVQADAQAVQVVAQADEPMTCGIPNSVLIANDIDPVILIDLPEELQAVVLSEINWQPPAQQQQQEQQQQQQPAQQVVQIEGQVQAEEVKEPAVQQQEQQPANNDPFGIDPEILASLPAEMRQELLNNESFRNQNLGMPPPSNPVQREAEAMDVASIIMTAATPQLRAEMLANLDEATIRTLPDHLQRESEAAQAAIRNRRNRDQQEIQRLFAEAQQQQNRNRQAVDRLADRMQWRRGQAHNRQHGVPVHRPPPRGVGGMFEDRDIYQRDGEERLLNFLDHMGRYGEPPRAVEQEVPLFSAVASYCSSLNRAFEDPLSLEQQINNMEQQIVNEDLVVEGVIQLLLQKALHSASEASALDQQQSTFADPISEDAGACKLIQFINCITMMKSSKGELKLINKFINAIGLLLKSELQQQLGFRKLLFDAPDAQRLHSAQLHLQTHQIGAQASVSQDQVMQEVSEVQINTEKLQNILDGNSFENYSKESMTVILTLIGVIRLVAKEDRDKHISKFQSHMLKCLLFREDYFAKKGVSMLQKQTDFMKQSNDEIQPFLMDILECLESLKANQKALVKQLSGLDAEDPAKRKGLTEKQAQLKTLSHNLQLAALDVFSEFNQPIVEAMSRDDKKNWKISNTAVKALLQILELQVVDQDPLLLNQLSSTLISMFNKSSDSWQLIYEQCQEKTISTLTEVNLDLLQIELDLLRGRKIVLQKTVSNGGTPTKMALEERKSDELMHHHGLEISRQSSQLSDIVRESIQDENTLHLKLDSSQEAKLRSILVDQKEKITGLKHIFQLFNMIYKEICKKNAQKDKKKAEKPEESAKLEEASEANQKIIDQIRNFYQSREMYEHMRLVNLALQTLSASKMDLIENMAGNLTCIFGAYMPDLQEMIEDSQKNKRRLQIDSGKEEKVTIKPLELNAHKSKVLSLFKNVDAVTDRLKEFASLCLKNKKAINQYLQLKTRTFNDFSITDIINYMPNILNFENKRAYFKKEIDKLKRNAPHDEIGLNIRRSQIFMDAYSNLNYRKGDIKGKFRIKFDGEAGLDAGGVSRDFFIELSRQMFNPDYSLFKLCSNGVSHYVAQNSFINPDHLHYLTFVGRMIGKALFDGQYMDCYFAKPLYKMILGEDLAFADLEDLDNEFYQGLKWMLTNDVDNATLFFSVDKEFFGRHEEFDLIPNGRNIPVTNENKLKYIEHRIHFYLYGIVSQQVDAFLTGFHELIPKDLIRVFDHKELEMLISGLPNFDLADLKKYTELDGYTNDSHQIIWFWETLQAMDQSEIGLFLQFVTGCSKIPLEGFKNLQGMRGVQHFTIKRLRITDDDIQRLPQGHTCFNQLDLPEYPSKELLQERLLFAIKETNVIAMT